MQIKRRHFLGSAVAGATGAMVSGNIPEVKAEDKPAAPVSTDPCAKVKLGDIEVCRIGMGTGVKSYNRVSELTKQGDDAAADLMRFAYDEGVRLMDSADLYGSHPLIAKAWSDKPRDSYYVVSKLWFHKNGLPEPARDDADVAVKRFLKEIKSDYIDVVQIHCQSNADWTDQFAKQMDLLEKCKEEGLIRAHGVTVHGNPALDTAIETPWVDTMHVRINPFGVRMAGTFDEVVAKVEKAHAAGKGVIAMKVFGEGAIASEPEKMQESIDKLVSLDCIDAMVIGFLKREDITGTKKLVEAALKKQAEAAA